MKRKGRTHKPDAWMPLFIADYLADTGRLTTEGHGAYLLLIMEYWRQNGPLVDDDDDLAAITRMSVERWAVMRKSIARFFDVSEGVWRHKRIDDELAIAWENHAAAQRRSQAGNSAKAAQSEPTGSLEGALKEPMGDPVSAPTSPSPSPISTPSASISAGQPFADDGDDERPIDLKAEIWRRGKRFLGKHGVPEPRAGPMIGRWRRDHGDGAVLDALTKAEAEAASEVIPFIEACLKGKSRHGQQRVDDHGTRRSAFAAGLATSAVRSMGPDDR